VLAFSLLLPSGNVTLGVAASEAATACRPPEAGQSFPPDYVPSEERAQFTDEAGNTYDQTWYSNGVCDCTVTFRHSEVALEDLGEPPKVEEKLSGLETLEVNMRADARERIGTAGDVV
jgi:hypothetical protein